ncbi:MAG TPA: restriction endonuclease subunit S [Chthoniobacterales bacterium]
MSSTGSFALTLARLRVQKHRGFVAPTCFRSFPAIDRDFLFHFLRTPEFTAKASQAAVGVNLPRLSSSLLSTFDIPLPPLPFQRRIAEVLDRAEALRAKRRAALAQLDSLTQLLFLDLFGDPVSNPNGVKLVRLADVATRITDGVHQKPNYTETGGPFISVKDITITTGKLIFDQCKFISVEDHERFTKRCKPERLDPLHEGRSDIRMASDCGN